MKNYKRPRGDARTSEIDNFAYQGTEIYSLLRSLPYHTNPRPEDKDKKLVSIDPANTTRYRLGLIKRNWEPKVAAALVRGLYQRFKHDPRLTSDALDAFRDGVKKAFGEEEAKAILE